MSGERVGVLAGRSPRVGIYIPSFGDGGVERMLVNLARGFADEGVRVDLLVRKTSAPYLGSLPAAVHVRAQAARGPRGLRRELIAYLRQEQPDILMSAKGPDDRIAIAARRRAGVPTRFFLRTGTNLSGRLAARRFNPLRRWWRRWAVRRLYRQADGVICVSQGVAEDLAGVADLPAERLQVIRNPVVVPELIQQAEAPVDHPWLGVAGPPVVLGAGGLRRQKNFALLLGAFARVRATRPARLLILGEGHLRGELERLAHALGVEGDVGLPGFVENPYPYMRQASIFVLSSLWEGSPNVLVEALALGTPVVATDCPSGPREILQGGRLGPLVPVDDESALAEAMLRTLAAPLPPETLRQGVADYHLARSARAYLVAFGLGPGGSAACAEPWPGVASLDDSPAPAAAPPHEA
jgi:glycosyltransferase involved in cell wall biosynthesis